MRNILLISCLLLMTSCLPEENKKPRYDIRTSGNFTFLVDSQTGDTWRIIKIDDPTKPGDIVGWYWSPMQRFMTREEENAFADNIERMGAIYKENELRKALKNPFGKKAPERN